MDGWVVYYKRGTSGVIAPEEIFSNVVLYRTVEGAQVIMEDYSTCANDSRYVLVETELLIGDMTNICVLKQYPSSEEYEKLYRIEFSYRNYFQAIVGYGRETEVDPEYIEDIAWGLFEKLKAAPLSNSVSFSP